MSFYIISAFSLLSYRFDESTWIYNKLHDVILPKIYRRNPPSEWYRWPNFQGLAHGLCVLHVLLGYFDLGFGRIFSDSCCEFGCHY